jgi:hypothetical protein
MKLNKLLFFVLIPLLVTSCSSSGGGTSTPAVTLTSIDVTQPASSIVWNTTQQFTATGHYSDNTSQNITTSVTWKSSDTGIATISNASGFNGLATPLTAGTTNITASSGNISSDPITLTIVQGPINNVLNVTVNGSLCSAGSYPNKPCVSVTICSPGTSICETIYDVLLDTGSTGLRIFKSLLPANLSLTQVTSNDSGSLVNCIQYADGSADWGPVQIADVILGNEKAANVPIQIINSTFGTTSRQIKSLCGTPDSSPATAGFNGILGVGLFTEDCGSKCASSSSNGRYYSCSGSTCNSTKAPLSDQIKNPVSLLPADNNGVIVQLPVIPTGGVTSADGILILGIDKQSNNSSSGVTMYHTDLTNGDLITVFNNNTYSDSFIDSGSNGLFLNASSMSALTTCSSATYANWFCPSSTQSLSATTKGYEGSPSGTVYFQIGNASSLLSSSYNVFIELGGPDTSFDWGLPFFLGRSVYVGIENKTSSLGTGPYWAY